MNNARRARRSDDISLAHVGNALHLMFGAFRLLSISVPWSHTGLCDDTADVLCARNWLVEAEAYERVL